MKHRGPVLMAVLMAICVVPVPSSAQSVPTAVEWINPVKVSVAGGALTKSSGCNDCPDAGAISSAQLSGDGYVEFAPVAGQRMVAGLGTDLTASTSWTIDYAFSFWPAGTWEIRELGNYRGEGTFSAGDRFRVVVQGTTVRYQKNGVTVYSSTLTATFPLVADTSIFTVGGGLADSVLGPLDAIDPVGPTTEPTPAPAPSPSPIPTPAPGTIDTTGVYAALIDRVAYAEPPLPALSGASWVFVDPTFGSRIIRLTDGLTRPGRLDRSYRTPSSAHQHSWSAGGSYFYVMSTDGTVVPYRFDRTTGSAARIDPTTTGDGGLVVRSYIEPQFSYVADNLIYGSYSGPGATLRTIDQYDFTSNTYSTLVNLDQVVANLAGTFVGWIGSSGGPVERIATLFGGASQDKHHLAMVFDKADPSRRHVVDTTASTLDGQPTNIPLNFSLHAMGIDRSGRYVMLYTTWADMSDPRKAAPSYLWDVAAGTFTELPLVSARNGGHDAYGYGVRVNQYCCTSTSYDAAQWQFRSLDAPFATHDVIQPVMTPKEVYLADHSTWHNARPDALMPFVSALYRSTPDTVAWRAWDEEIVGVQTDAVAGTATTVWRFAHHRSNVANDADPTLTAFWYMPRPSVSDDGRWVLFTSNWEKSLGRDAGGDASAGYRQDVFVVQLRTNAVDATVVEPEPTPEPVPAPPPAVTPISITTATMPDGVRRKAYSAALTAADAQGTVTWTVSVGALPSGLSLNAATGVISGTCQKVGTFAFTVSAADAAGVATKQLSIQVRLK